MQLLTKEIPKNCKIALLGDEHYGNLLQHEEGLQEVRDWIAAKPNRFFVHMGDECDNVATDDKRFQHDTNCQPIPLQQMMHVERQYEPIAHKCLTWLDGNHNFTLQRFGNLTKMLCDDLGIDFGTWTCKLRLMCNGQQVCKMFLTHKVGNVLRSSAKDFEQQQANMLASLKRRLIHKSGDCLIMGCGHTHKLLCCQPAERLILSDDGEKLQQKYLGAGDGAADYIEPDRRWYVNTGSFLRLYKIGVTSYAERAGYDPIELGYIKVTIKDAKVKKVERVVV